MLRRLEQEEEKGEVCQEEEKGEEGQEEENGEERRRGAWASERVDHLSAMTCAQAAHGGHITVLQWARAQGCVWDTSTCEQAARGGHLTVLQWARASCSMS